MKNKLFLSVVMILTSLGLFAQTPVYNVMDYGEKVSIDLPSKDFERMKANGTIESYIEKYLADRRKAKTNEMLNEVSVKDEEPIERVEAEVVDKEEDDFHYRPGGNKEEC